MVGSFSFGLLPRGDHGSDFRRRSRRGDGMASCQRNRRLATAIKSRLASREADNQVSHRNPLFLLTMVTKSCFAEPDRETVAVIKEDRRGGGLSLSRCLLVQASDTLLRGCRNAKPRPAKPSNIIAHVDVSGTALIGPAGSTARKLKLVPPELPLTLLL